MNDLLKEAVKRHRNGERCKKWDEAIINAYMAEHPADDDEPVTAEWFVSVGLKQHWKTPHGTTRLSTLETEQDDAWIEATIYSDTLRGGVRLEAYGTSDSSLYIKKQSITRGEVRRLCTALGIKLKG